MSIRDSRRGSAAPLPDSSPTASQDPLLIPISEIGVHAALKEFHERRTQAGAGLDGERLYAVVIPLLTALMRAGATIARHERRATAQARDDSPPATVPADDVNGLWPRSQVDVAGRNGMPRPAKFAHISFLNTRDDDLTVDIVHTRSGRGEHVEMVVDGTDGTQARLMLTEYQLSLLAQAVIRDMRATGRASSPAMAEE